MRAGAGLVVLEGLLLVVAEVGAVVLSGALQLGLILGTRSAQGIDQPLLPVDHQTLRQSVLLLQVLLRKLLRVHASWVVHNATLACVVLGLRNLLLLAHTVAHIAFGAIVVGDGVQLIIALVRLADIFAVHLFRLWVLHGTTSKLSLEVEVVLLRCSIGRRWSLLL